MIRRSVSISFSPGPFMPMPPFCFCRWVHMLVRRGRRYWYWANSTWVFACAVRARCAKMSKIKLGRSRIFRSGISRSMLRSWVGLNSSSKMSMSTSFSSTNSLISWSFPLPTNVRVSGRSNPWIKVRSEVASAVEAKKANSSRCSSTVSRDSRPVTSPIRIHVSGSGAVEWDFFLSSMVSSVPEFFNVARDTTDGGRI